MTIDEYIGQSAVKNVTEALERATKLEDYNALISLTAERAIERAKAVDEGKITGRLAGVPFVIKDNFLAHGAPTTAASRMLESFDAPLQATAVERLEAEGAICIGKANLDAYAHGGSTENSAFGPARNAVNETRVPGGSSGGSAVVTALGIVPFALGTDTGGSIRQPASFNGVVGVKPTYGAVSRYGVIAMASSTDTIGCFATSAKDADLVMGIMAGKDEKDMTSLPVFWNKNQVLSTRKIGLIKQCMTDGVDSQVLAKTREFCQKLTSLGYQVEEVDLPMMQYTLAMYYIIVSAEVSSNLARYDGVRFGRRTDNAKTLLQLYGKSRDESFEIENKRRIMMGSFVLSSGFFDAYYLQAQKARTLLIQEFSKLFETYEALISPTTPTVAFKLGENTADPVQMYLADVMTVPASLAGLPAISVPAGADTEGMPIGVQLIGPSRSDHRLLEIASEVEAGVRG